jgi:leucyl-tRNA synthetase
MSTEPVTEQDTPPFRYTAALASEIENRWQDRWQTEGTFHAPNPTGPMAEPKVGPGGVDLVGRPKMYVLDMFPYPSGAGLHVGHPLGYIATDVLTRFQRMNGHNVLYTMGFDAFGLPAEQYAVQTGAHPRKTTEDNVMAFRRQLRRLGLGHDDRRSVATTDVEFYRWTQWIFLQIFNSWFDRDQQKARPIAELIAEFEAGERRTPDGRAWSALTDVERREVVDGFRLVYRSDAPVNWCPGLGTVLANEEVTADGRSERGNFPVFKRNLTQWMMRITAYADRLIDDLDRMDWPESVKIMQRNWIGRSSGAAVHFATDAGPLTVFTTRPDTLFGATYMVVSPEHPILETLVPAAWPEGTKESWTGGHATPGDAVTAYQAEAAKKTDTDRTEAKVKTGVFTGAYAVNPVNGAKIPVFTSDYVLMGYGTGAIMAVPGQDQRDWDFTKVFDLPIIRTVQPPAGFDGEAYVGEGAAINSANDEISLNGLGVAEAKAAIIEWLEKKGLGEGTIQYKLRDWLFSRQRYWGEPFPIVYDETGLPVAVPESMLPVELPDVADYSPRTYADDDANSMPEPPLGKATDWVEVELDLGDGPKKYRRETNVMPQWAGSCWYELRYLDPTNNEAMVDAEVEKYWMGPRHEGDVGGADLYVGGVEHAVLHLLYSRFWHKVLFDLGHVSSAEPFHRLINQGYIQAYAFKDQRGQYVPAADVEERDGKYFYAGEEVAREYGKIGKSLKNVVTPDEICQAYGADTFRVYEMSTGPLETSRPWETRAVVGAYRFLQRVWRLLVDEQTGELTVSDAEIDEETLRLLHKTIDGVRKDYAGLKANTATAKLIELTNRLTAVAAKDGAAPRAAVEPLVLMTAPLAPHVAEELWSRLGHPQTLTFEDFPVADQKWLVAEEVTYPVQVNGKVRGRVTVPADADSDAVLAAALADPAVAAFLDGRDLRKSIVVPGRIVTLVV